MTPPRLLPAVLLVLCVTSSAALAWTPVGETEADRNLWYAAFTCDTGSSQAVTRALAEGANLKHSMKFEHTIVDLLAVRAAEQPRNSACLEGLKAVLAAGAEPNPWWPDTTPLARIETHKLAQEVADLLRKAGAIEHAKVVPDCETAKKTGVQHPNRYVRAYARYLLRQSRCNEWVEGGGRYVSADVARVRSAPNAQGTILRLARINSPIVVTDEVQGEFTRMDEWYSDTGWIATSALRKTPTTVEEAREALGKAVASGETAQIMNWANRLQLLSPLDPEDQQRAISAYEAANDTARAAAAEKARKGDATVFIAFCHRYSGHVVAQLSKAEGLKPIKSPAGLGQWVGALNWFRAGGDTASLVTDTYSEHHGDRGDAYDEEVWMHFEHVELQGVCGSGAVATYATAPFVELPPKRGKAKPNRKEIELRLGDSVHRLALETVETGKSTKTTVIRVVPLDPKGRPVERKVLAVKPRE
jgi:hypothetical protein